MVRTKDLVLLVSVLIMLFLAISATLATRMLNADPNAEQIFGANEQAPPAYSANAEINTKDRASTIERLRALIAKGDVIDAAPSVTEPVEAEANQAATSTENLLNCQPPATGINVARRWPLEDVDVNIAGGLRTVSHTVYAPAVGTTTPPKIVSERPLLQLPLVPVVLAKPTCPDSEIVGVTADGSLIFNNDAVLHRQTGSEVLVGYARDGFPIYGAYAGAQDECGGYQSATGYRYAASPSESTFLKCFKGAPRVFTP